MEPVRGLLTDSMFNMYKTQSLTLSSKHQKNVMKDFDLKDIYISSVDKYTDHIEIKLIVKMNFKDYIIDDRTEKIVRGDKKEVHATYLFVYRADRLKEPVDKCPNCGQELKDKTSLYCPSCRSLIVKPSETFVLAEKKMIRQE